jgi:hypothetical protein
MWNYDARIHVHPIDKARPLCVVSSTFLTTVLFMRTSITHVTRDTDVHEYVSPTFIHTQTHNTRTQISLRRIINHFHTHTRHQQLVPFPLLFLRYSAFLILYPIGVSGEILCAYSTAPLLEAGKCPSVGGLISACPSNALSYLYIFLLMYIPGLPMLYLGMLGERKKRLYPKPVPKPSGIVFPVTKGGDRSTTATVRCTVIVGKDVCSQHGYCLCKFISMY